MTKSPVPGYVHKATEKKLLAEAEAAEAAAEVSRLEAAQHKLSLEATEIQMSDVRRLRDYQEADDSRHRIYRFTKLVTDASATACIDTLTRWSRIDETNRGKAAPCGIEIVFFSPGGSVADGMALFDTIRALSRSGHTITTTAIGEAASMAAILLQAGDVRRMHKGASLLIHEVSYGASGSASEVEDRVEWIKRVQGRIIDIFMDRMKGAKKKLKREAFVELWKRRDWWLASEDALAYGIVDVVL
jgi:ATP-dependent Clp endopeptidase proteolytic subunit ClpP